MLRKLTLNDRAHLKNELKQISKVTNKSLQDLSNKGDFHIFKTEDISVESAKILRKESFNLDADYIIPDENPINSRNSVRIIILGNRFQYLNDIKILKNTEDNTLQYLGHEIEQNLQKEKKVVRLDDKKINLNSKTLIMGVLNVTPDSFSDGGEYNSLTKAIDRAQQMVDNGADIIDIGGESTRPGADPVPLEEELSRVIPVIQKINTEMDIPISIDTYKSKVAEKAMQEGADIINDISGFNFDEKMPEIAAEYKATVVLMHIKGKPRNMQKNPTYDNMIDEILNKLNKSTTKAQKAGIPEDKIIIDPGIGFGKKWQDNYYLLRHLREFKALGYPILIGPSRKSFIGNLLDLPTEERLEGTLASVSAGIMNGADIVRVHDVKETARAVKVTDKILGKTE